MITSQEGDGEILQVGDPDIVEVRPEKCQAVQHISIRVCKVFCIHAVGNDEQLNEMIQAVIGMLFITHNLVDGFTDINATTL